MRKPRSANRNQLFAAALAVFLLLGVSSCLPKPATESGGPNITLYGFSVMKESLEKAIYPGFAAKWKREHGQDVRFTSSFAGSETVTNQILQGVSADLAILSIDRDAQRLKDKGFITTDWHASPYKGIVNKYGSELVKSEKQSGEPDKARALQTLQAIWKNVISTPASAREARTTFELGNGDALVTYELEGLLMKQANAPVEIVVPQATVFSEHPAVIIDKNVLAERRPLVEAFLQYLWSDEAQQAFVRFHFYSVTNNAFNEANKELGHIEMPFTVEYFGGWDNKEGGKSQGAYPEVIEQIFRDQVQRRK